MIPSFSKIKVASAVFLTRAFMHGGAIFDHYWWQGATTADVKAELFKIRLDVNTSDGLGKTALHYASEYAKLEYVKLLLDAGADATAQDKKGNIPLHQTASSDIAQMLLEAGSDVNSLNENRSTPLHKCFFDDIKKYQTLLDYGADVTARDKNGDTPLHYALLTPFDEYEIVKILLRAGSDVNAKNNFAGTPLSQSVFSERTESTKLLLAAGAEVNSQNKWGMSPLHTAASCGTLETMMDLLNAGANISVCNENGWSALHFARTPQKIKALIDFGASVLSQTADGETPLHTAVLSDATFKVKIEKIINAHVFYRLGNEDVDCSENILVLLAAGAEAKSKDKNSNTPWDLAQQNKNLKGTKGYWALNNTQYK